MAQADEILTRYKLDIQQPEQVMNKYAQTLAQTEEAGEKAFAGIGEAAEISSQKIANAGRVADKSKRQFDQLGNSVNQLSRELPAFAVSINTGFLAISNNIPALFDAIDNLRSKNAELAASGQKTTSVLKQFAASVFSLQTAFSIGITLLTVYGGKILSFITGQEDSAAATKKAEAELKKFNDQLKIQRILQNTLDNETKNRIALIEKNTATGAKAANLQTLQLKQQEESIALNERQEQSVQELFKAYEINYTDFLQLQKAISDPAFAAALGETRLRQLRGQAGDMEKVMSELGISDFTPLLNTTTEFNDRLKNLRGSFEAERLALKKKQDKEYFDLLDDQNKAIAQNEINDLKRQMKLREAAGKDITDIQIDIFDKELALLDPVTQEYKDKYNERQAFIISKEREIQKLLDDFRKKNTFDLHEQAGEELTILTNAYFAEKDLEKKKQDDAEKQRRELLGDSVKSAMKNRADRKKELEDIENDESKSFDKRQKALKDLYDEGLITTQEYTEAEKTLSNERALAALAAISQVSSALGAFAQLLGENTEAGKALAIAQTTIDTYVAAQKAYLSQMQLTPDSPIRATIAAAVAVAAGLARVARISSVSVPKPNSSNNVKSAGDRGFATGVVDINGEGTGTSDSIPAWISKGESVITAKSTSRKKDELIALNKGVPDYEALLYKKYVKPAIDIELEKQNAFAANIAKSIVLHAGFNDARIVKAIEKNKPATSDDIRNLTEVIAKRDRTDKFESKLKQPKHGR